MDVDHEGIKQRARAVWSGGRYSPIAALLEPAAQALVDACAISAGQEVLDVASGTGNVALAAAREGAAVVGSDLTPKLLEEARERAEAEGLEVEWVEADAEALPFDDARFDCATSAFGAMFAPRPEVVARELFRVVRPGNTVGMCNWTPEGFQGHLFEVVNRHVGLAEGVPPAVLWGSEEVVEERFAGLAGTIDTERRTVHFELPSLDSMRELFDASPQGEAARGNLPREVLEAFRADQEALVREWNSASDGSIAIDCEYLLVVARRRG